MRPNVNVGVSGPKAPSEYTYKTVVLKNNLPFAAQVTEPWCIYVIRWDFDLKGETVIIPENCVLKFVGGSLCNGTIVLSSNVSIDGMIFYQYLDPSTGTSKNAIKVENANNVRLHNCFIDGGFTGAESVHQYNDHNLISNNNLIKIDGCSNVVIDGLEIQNWYQSWVSEDNYVDYGRYCAHILDSQNIYVNNLTLDNIRPESFYFHRSSQIKVENFSINDVRGLIWTAIHFFDCEEVILDKANILMSKQQGSTINFTVKKGIISNCIIKGGQGIDLSNETDSDYVTSNITIRDCIMEDSNSIMYSYPSKGQIDKVLIDNVYYKNSTPNTMTYLIDGRHIRNLIVQNCHVDVNRFAETQDNLGVSTFVFNRFMYNDGTVSINSNYINGLDSIVSVGDVETNDGVVDITNNYIVGDIYRNGEKGKTDIVFYGSTTDGRLEVVNVENNIVSCDSRLFARGMHQAMKLVNVGTFNIQGNKFSDVAANSHLYKDTHLYLYDNVIASGYINIGGDRPLDEGETVNAANYDIRGNRLAVLSVLDYTELLLLNNVVDTVKCYYSMKDKDNTVIDGNIINTLTSSVSENNLQYIRNYGDNINSLLTDKGTTRPSNYGLGKPFFDETLGKPVWWTADGWVDALGEPINS